MKPPFKQELFEDALSTFEEGVNSELPPLLLSKKQMALAINTTCRGAYARPRPPFRKLRLDNDLLTEALADGPFQGAEYYQPDSGTCSIIVSIGGRIFKVLISGDLGTVTELTIGGDPNPPYLFQAWMWQGENYMFINDGVSNPLFFNGTSLARSTFGATSSFSTTTTANFIVPVVNGTSVVVVAATSAANMAIGDIVTFGVFGQMVIQSISGLNITFLNINAPAGRTVTTGAVLSWAHQSFQLPPGRMGAYIKGRNWFSLVNGKWFMASDIVGGSSGTAANNFRDAILNITENSYLKGGGFFVIPSGNGTISAIRAATILDASLGQGPVQIFTERTVFSCNASPDRLEWQDVTNPILTESLIGAGARSQDATKNANGDILFLSSEGLRSLILARREFQTWGNVPQSEEVNNVFVDQAEQSLLRFASSIVFDNRFLTTARPLRTQQGIYHRAIVPLNFDPLSSLRGKAPSIYDANSWNGLNIFRLVVGIFDDVERAFALTYNESSREFEIFEILPTKTELIYDSPRVPIPMEIWSASLFRYAETDHRARALKQLSDGEIFVDNLQDTANFQVWYRPDQWPCWVPWFTWSECQRQPVDETAPGFRPRMGLGEPTGKYCDPDNNRPLRQGYTFQVKIICNNCRFLGARFSAFTVPESSYAKQKCEPICEPLAV